MLRAAQNICRASHLDPEDLVHEALERALRQLESGSGPDPLTVAFVTTVMTNRHIDLCRRRRASGDTGEPPPEETGAPEADGAERWRVVSDERFQEAISSLRPQRIQDAYRLHAEGLRYRQIAARLGVAEGTVGADLTEARRQLREYLMDRASAEGQPGGERAKEGTGK